MIARASERVAVAGLTGKQGRFWSARMRECGTTMVAGTSPGQGRSRGRRDLRLRLALRRARRPRHRSRGAVHAAARHPGGDVDALAAGIMRIVVLTEHIPVHDVMCFLADARDAGAQVIGPEHRRDTSRRVKRRSASCRPTCLRSSSPAPSASCRAAGDLGTLVCLNVVRAGYGESAFIGIGGDPVLGTTTRDALEILDRDPRTKAAVIVGELGGAMEEDAAEDARSMRKPVLAFIAGRTAPPGRRMGHAGAIVDGARGTGESKVTALRDAGVRVAETPSEIGVALRAVLA